MRDREGDAERAKDVSSKKNQQENHQEYHQEDHQENHQRDHQKIIFKLYSMDHKKIIIMC